jgi:transposase
LKSQSKRAKHESTRIRAAILLASNVRMSGAADRGDVADRCVVRAEGHSRLQRAGMNSLPPRNRGGRPGRITSDQRMRIVSVAGARPDHQGVPLTRWSLPRLAIYLAEQDIAQVSFGYLGQLLAEAGLSFQRTRTWKASRKAAGRQNSPVLVGPRYTASARPTVSGSFPRRTPGARPEPPTSAVLSCANESRATRQRADISCPAASAASIWVSVRSGQSARGREGAVDLADDADSIA